jgi:ribosomal protein S18 acetylase RimI-like enzyme
MTMTDQETLTVRTVTEKELELAVTWAAEEGWNPGIRDAACFRAADPNGFFMAFLGERPVGSISAVAYDESFGFMGFYIVRPDLRGHGIGMELWRTAVGYMGSRNVGGDGVVAMLENYQKSGFSIAHRNIRFEGVGTVAAGAPATVDISQVPFEDLLRYDSAHFPAPRPDFLRRWIDQPEGGARALLRDGQLSGYGVIRACRRGFKIAPLFAEDPEGAEQLFTGLAGLVSGASVFLDVPEPNRAAVELAERHGMTPVFETARIYTRGAPDLPLHEIYGITSFELG